MKDIRILALVSGTWSKAGNYTAKTITGEKFFVSKAQMESLGYDSETKNVPTLWVAVATNSYNVIEKDAEGKNVLDANGVPKVKLDENGNAISFTRDETTAIFKSKEELITASNANDLLQLERKMALRKDATALGVKEDVIDAVLTASAI
jgi:hypothetical protein